MTTLETARQDVAAAVVRHLADVGVGTLALGNQVFGKDDTALIDTGPVPPQPDRVVSVVPYMVVPPGPRSNDAVVRIQCRVRGARRDPGSMVEITGRILEALHLQHAEDWGDVHVQRCRYLYGTWMGIDQNERHEESHNFEVLIQVNSGSST